MHASRNRRNKKLNVNYNENVFLTLVAALGRNLLISIEHDGPFGKYVKLARGERCITFSTNIWLKLRSHVPMLKSLDFKIQLTEDKNVNVFSFNGVQYVGFHQTYKRNGDVYSRYINLNETEWASFLKALTLIDTVIAPSEIIPCPSCYLLKTVMPIINGRARETTLSPEMLQEVRENNKIAYNQEMYRCEYCGGYSYQINSGCHCHRYDCHACEPENFCTTCGSVKIFAV